MCFIRKTRENQKFQYQQGYMSYQNYIELQSCYNVQKLF